MPPVSAQTGASRSEVGQFWRQTCGIELDSIRMVTIKFAERMTRLGTEGAFEGLARARKLEAEGKKIVHLEIGGPDFAPPDNIVEAGISALQNGYTHYTPPGGIKEVREAVAAFVSRMLWCDVDGSEGVLVPCSKNVLLFTLLATVAPGDDVVRPDPGYPAYHS